MEGVRGESIAFFVVAILVLLAAMFPALAIHDAGHRQPSTPTTLVSR